MTLEYRSAVDICKAAAEENGIGRLLDVCSAVAVGYSGGADSTLLLHMLADYLQDKKIFAIHLNHGIRGKEADEDEAFCRETAAALGVSFISEKVDVPSLSAKSGDGIEEAARKVRYDFFDRCAEKIGGNVLIATAHNSDDNLETVLFNMLRGCGANGMTGIPPVRDGKYVRPILPLSSDSVRRICDSEGFSYRTDSTNADTDYTRNYMRAEIIPRLRKINAHPEKQVAKMCALLRCDDEFITSEAERVRNGGMMLAALKNTHKAVATRAIMLEYRDKLKTDKTLTNRNIEDVMSLVKHGADGDRISLPGGVSAVVDFDRLAICDDAGEATSFFEKALPGENNFDEYGFSVVLLRNAGTPCNENINAENIYKLFIYNTVRFDTIKGQIIIRSREAGDTYKYGGMTRKVKKLLCDKKIPRSERERLPVIADDNGILWIPGFPVRDGCGAEPSFDGETMTIIYYKK